MAGTMQHEYIHSWLLATHTGGLPQPSDDCHDRQSRKRRSHSFGGDPAPAKSISISALEKRLRRHQSNDHLGERKPQDMAQREADPSFASEDQNRNTMRELDLLPHLRSAREDFAIYEADDRTGQIDALDIEAQALEAMEKYARRRRHKTKADRYEYDENYTTSSLKRQSRCKEKKRNSHKKSGSKLNHGFKAPNVESERLTLKQSAMPGIFSKGKASALTERRDLPDLTFSEMAFLSKKRDLNEARHRGVQSISQPAQKGKGNAKEVSVYFDRPAKDCYRSGGQSIPSIRGDTDAMPLAGHTPHTASASLRDFRTERSTERDKVRLTLEPGQTHALTPDQSSRLSWSTSPARSEPLRHMQTVQRTAYPQYAATNARKSGPNRSDIGSVQPRSSISSVGLDRDNVNHHGSRKQNINPGVGVPFERRHCTLEDLIYIAERQCDALNPSGIDSTSATNPSGMVGIDQPVSQRITTARPTSFKCIQPQPDRLLMPKAMSRDQHSLQQIVGSERVERPSTAPNRELQHEFVDPPFLRFIQTPDYDLHATEDRLDDFDYALLDVPPDHQFQEAGTELAISLQDQQQNSEQYQHHWLQDAAVQEFVDHSTVAANRSDQRDASDSKERPQLLRPSYNDLNASTAFEGYARPRFLY